MPGLRDYELVVILSPEIEEPNLDASIERVQQSITARGGEIVDTNNWGRRRLAYPIGGFRDGIYLVTRFKMPPEEADALEHSLGLTESVIRHLVVRPDGA